jgi:hypothetical protein
MTEEHQSIKKNDVWEIVPRPKEKEGEDYDETFSKVARYTSIRAIISLAASMGWNLHQMDVAYLSPELAHKEKSPNHNQ